MSSGRLCNPDLAMLLCDTCANTANVEYVGCVFLNRALSQALYTRSTWVYDSLSGSHAYSPSAEAAAAASDAVVTLGEGLSLAAEHTFDALKVLP
jgi:hypothetical protein